MAAMRRIEGAAEVCDATAIEAGQVHEGSLQWTSQSSVVSGQFGLRRLLTIAEGMECGIWLRFLPWGVWWYRRWR
jgi:hypothetical protein